MLDFVLESIRIVTMTLLLGYLLWIGSRNALHRQSGWGYFVTGFALVFVGSVFDITGNFPGLDDSAVIAGSAAQAFLDKVGGSLIGHSLILLGLLQWVPLISRVYRPGKLELKRYSEKLGTLVEDRTAELTFSNNRLLKVLEDRNHAVAFAEDMNRWLIESETQLDKAFQELAGLYEISRIFSTMGDLATKATAALEKVAVMSRADWVTLRMPKEDETGMHLVASAGPAVAESAPVAVFTGTMTMSSAAFTEGRRIVIDDYPAAPHANQVLVDLGMRSMVILPVKARDRTVGLVTVVSQKPRHFTKELVDLVTAVVEGFGGLIENSMLHEESEKANLEQRRLVEEKSAMAEISRIINLSPDIDDIYETFAVELAKLVAFDSVLVTLADLEEQTMTITYTSGPPIPERSAGAKFTLAGTYTWAVMNQPVGLVLDYSQSDSPTPYQSLAPYLDAGFCSFLGVKLVHHDQTMGILNLVSARPGAYSERELEIAARAAHQIAGAIANARLYAQQRESEAEIRDLAKFPSEDPNSVARISSEGSIIYANDAAARILGSHGLNAGQHTLETWRGSATRVLAGGSANEVEISYGARTSSYSVVPVADAGYVNFYGRDITTAKEADRLKDEFISVASHELRTPGTSIKGFLELLEDEKTGPVTADQRRFLDAVGRNTRRLEMLVDDLLDISRLDSGMIGLERSEFSILEAFQQVVSEMQSEIVAKGLNVEFGNELNDAVADADRDRVIQILANLLSNANKYSPSGSPIYVDAKTNVDVASLLHVSIRDEGPGIDRQDADRLFEKFYRVDNSTTRDAQGTGLGLAITKALVDLHGGKI